MSPPKLRLWTAIDAKIESQWKIPANHHPTLTIFASGAPYILSATESRCRLSKRVSDRKSPSQAGHAFDHRAHSLYPDDVCDIFMTVSMWFKL
jgi:hypothetical protein